MMAEPDRQAQPGPAIGVTAKVASSLMTVSDLARSVNFYCDVFSCRVALHEQDTALLLTPGGFQIYLHSKGPSRRPRVGATGVQYLMWATDSQAELQRISQRLLAYDVATYSYTENGVTFRRGMRPGWRKGHRRLSQSEPAPARGDRPATARTPPLPSTTPAHRGLCGVGVVDPAAVRVACFSLLWPEPDGWFDVTP